MKMESVTKQEELTLGQFLRKRREEMNLGMRVMCRMTEKIPECGRPLSEKASYYSRIENDDPTIKISRISMDFFWAVGVVLQVDPSKLFVMSRKNIPQRLIDGQERNRVFRIK